MPSKHGRTHLCGLPAALRIVSDRRFLWRTGRVHPYPNQFETNLAPRADIYGYPAAVGLMSTGIAMVLLLRLHDVKHLRYVMPGAFAKHSLLSYLPASALVALYASLST